VQVPPPRLAQLVFLPFLVLGLGDARGGPPAPGYDRLDPSEVADPDRSPSPEPLIWEDVPEPLPPDRQRTEAEQDRVVALTLFSTGRALENQGQKAEALRRYQRALRYDPQAETLAKAVVRLAIQLKRLDEALRIALKVQNPDAFDPELWIGLGGHLMRSGDWQGAITMYERVLAARKDVEPTASDVILKTQMGQLYYWVGQYEKAADCFALVRQALDDPDKFGLDEEALKELLVEPGETYSVMGECFLRTDRADEAVAAFNKAHQVDPNEGLLGYRLARVEAQTGKPAEALATLQTYFDEHLSSEGTAPYRLLSEMLQKLAKKDELVPRLEKLRADDPENVPLGYFLAETYREAEQLDKAEPLYRLLVEKTPTITGYRSLVAIYRETGRTETLLNVLGEAAGKGIALESLGAEGRSISDDADLVRSLIQAARKQLESNPDELDYHRRLAVALLALDGKQVEEAGQFFELAIRADPDQTSELLFTWGLGLLADEQYAEAARVFQRGVDQKVPPEDEPIFYYYLAGALEMDGRTEESLAAARKAADLKKDVPRFLSRVAWILYHNDRREEAAQAYRELIEKFDSDFSSAEGRQVLRESRLVLSNLAVLAGDMPQAVEWLEEVLDEFPDDIGALNDLGYLWADQNVKLQRAHRMIRQAVEGDPDNAAYRDSLGWVLYRSGRVDEAIVELEQAAALDLEKAAASNLDKAAAPEADPVILDHLGDAYQAAGKLDKAKDAWRRALKAFEQEEETDSAKKVRQKLEDNP
jgi:tetratricopeptide (TPR) repeat protein